MAQNLIIVIKQKVFRKGFKIYLFLMLISCIKVYGQKDSTNYFFNEFNVNLNFNSLSNGFLKEQIGFGAGTYRSIISKNKINFILGFEYNLNRHFVEREYEGHYAHATNIKYSIHNFSIPFNFRYNFGRSVKIITELGVFVDLITSSKRKGVLHTYLPFESYKKSEFSRGAKIIGPSYGVSCGFGILMPVFSRVLIIKSDFKFGFNKLDSKATYNTYFYVRYFRLNIGFSI
jgi:hypothetical protein